MDSRADKLRPLMDQGDKDGNERRMQSTRSEADSKDFAKQLDGLRTTPTEDGYGHGV